MKKLLRVLLVSALLLTLGLGVAMAQGLVNAIHSPEDFKAIYANLKAGSENHLATFDRVLNNDRGSHSSQRAKNNQSGKGNMNKNNNRANRGGNRK